MCAAKEWSRANGTPRKLDFQEWWQGIENGDGTIVTIRESSTEVEVWGSDELIVTWCTHGGVRKVQQLTPTITLIFEATVHSDGICGDKV